MLFFIILKILKKTPFQFKMGIFHPDTGISSRNMRLTASYRFCVLLVWLHNSCTVDANSFGLSFIEAFENIKYLSKFRRG